MPRVFIFLRFGGGAEVKRQEESSEADGMLMAMMYRRIPVSLEPQSTTSPAQLDQVIKHTEPEEETALKFTTEVSPATQPTEVASIDENSP